MGVMHIRLWML